MHSFGLTALVFARLAMASPEQPSAAASSDRELMNAFRASEALEIYVVRRDVESPVGIQADSLRRLACRYYLHRSMPQWGELERTMTTASVRIEQHPAYGEIRVGLVFADRTGTELEVYAGDLAMPDGRVKGYIQRREVAISGSFAQTIHQFVETHRDLAEVAQAMPELCGRPRPPDRPLIPPAFHFSNPYLDRDHQRLNDQVRAATMSFLRSSIAAHSAIGSGRDSPPDSPAWLPARDAVQQAVGDARVVQESLQAYGRFLNGAIQRVSGEEARLAMENRQLIPDQLRAESDALVNLLALLGRMQIGQWPP
jgi:hypothetical protein